MQLPPFLNYKRFPRSLGEQNASPFSYELQSQPGDPAALVVTVFGGDRRQFAIHVNGRPLADVTLPGDKKEFIEQRYPIPAAILDSSPGGFLTVEFSAAPGQTAGSVFGLTLMKAE